MEVHLAVGQSADRLAILADIGDQHHRRIAGREPPRVAHGERSETFGESDLVLLRELLIAQENDEVLVPDVQHLRSKPIVHRLAQIDSDDFGAQRGR